jgi:transposase
MFIRQFFQTQNGRRNAYWALVESYRTASGPRQRIVAWLGKLDEAGRLGVQVAAEHTNDPHASTATPCGPAQLELAFDEEGNDPSVEPRFVEVDVHAVRVENLKQFGGPWLALELVRRLRLDTFLERVLPQGREQVPWSLSALILVVARLLDPSSELYTAEQWYPKTALPELLGVPVEHVDDNRLYRTLDQLLPHKAALETHLKQRLGELFGLEYDLLLYDVTSTYFEGEAKANPLAQRGYSRDNRGDCKQVCIGLVVSRCGMPLGYEVFAGNTADSTTVEHIVETMEARYGKSDRIWVMDRGMVSEDKIAFLRKGQRRYLVGTPKPMLKRFEQELLKDDWHQIREGLEVKLCAWPGDLDAEETDAEVGQEDPEIFILCRSQDRFQKEDAIVRRFEQKIEARLTRMQTRCERQRRDVAKVERDVGRVLGQNTRAARLFDVRVERTETGGARLSWTKREAVRDWATLSTGCYLLRTNVTDWSDEDLWKTYIQLTEAEAAFRIHKSDLSLRPIWHQKQDRVLAHILVCFLAYVLWKMLAQWCAKAGLGHEPRRVLSELSELRQMDVVLPTREGVEIRTRCISRPSDHQQILLDHLGLRLPKK